MSNLIAIDPGGARKGCSAAAFWEGELTRISAMIRVWPGMAPCDVVIVERPQQDGRSRAVPPAILMDLAWQAALLAGAFVALGATLVEYLPAEWKGQIQKPVHHERIWAALSSAERAIVADTFQDPEIQILAARRKGALSRWARSSNAHYPANSRLPDVLDAVGLGLFHLGRITKDGNRK